MSASEYLLNSSTCAFSAESTLYWTSPVLHDRYEPAEILAEHGALNALVFECLAERTIALAQYDLTLLPFVGPDRRARVRYNA